MWIMKFIILSLIFWGTSYIGILISKKYDNRLNELQEIKSAIHMLEIKIRFTYNTIPKIFREIEAKHIKNIGKIFGLASEKMELNSTEKAWSDAIDETTNNWIVACEGEPIILPHRSTPDKLFLEYHNDVVFLG